MFDTSIPSTIPDPNSWSSQVHFPSLTSRCLPLTWLSLFSIKSWKQLGLSEESKPGYSIHVSLLLVSTPHKSLSFHFNSFVICLTREAFSVLVIFQEYCWDPTETWNLGGLLWQSMENHKTAADLWFTRFDSQSRKFHNWSLSCCTPLVLPWPLVCSMNLESKPVASD